MVRKRKNERFKAICREELGMEKGVAHHKLKKSIILELLKELKRDYCYRCGIQFTNYEEISVDHKQPWLHVSAELFWDYNNIAFSHKKCNKIDRPWLCGHKGSIRIISPEGMAWCKRCQSHLLVERFSKSYTRWNKVQSYCISCKSAHGYETRVLKPRRVPPVGTSWCSTCREYKDISLFHRNKSSWNGYCGYCKQCRSTYEKEKARCKKVLMISSPLEEVLSKSGEKQLLV